MVSRRKKGTGTIEARGERHSIRLTIPGKGRRRFGTAPTPEAADAIGEAIRSEVIREQPDLSGAVSLSAYGQVILDKREAQGKRNVDSERSKWKVHIEGTLIGNTPVDMVTPRMVRELRDRLAATDAAPGWKCSKPTQRKLSRSSVTQVLTLVRLVLADAKELGLVDINAADGVQAAKQRRIDDAWTYLTLDEQRRLLDAVAGSSPVEWPIVAVAMYTGIREGEQWALRLVDCLDDRFVVRFGGHEDMATKSGKPRTVPLINAAQKAMRQWRESGYRGKGFAAGLVFPTVRGKRRPALPAGAPKPPRRWRAWLKAAGIDRRVRWHDLRHTCATSLLCGLWGPAWTMAEVAALLGHSTTYVTAMYAHVVDDLAVRAVRVHNTEVRPTYVPRLIENAAPPARVELAANGLGTLFHCVEIVDESGETRPVWVVSEQNDPTDLELHAAWTSWGPRMSQLAGDPRDMSEQLRAAEGWA